MTTATKYKIYSKYKPSGIDWLGEIPENWKIMPIWMLFFIGRGRVISNEEILDNAGEYPVYSSQTENDGNLGGLATYDFEGDYITWTTDGANAGTVFNRTGKFNCTNVCGTLKSKRNKEIDLRFFTYALNVCTKIFVRYDINPKLMNNVIAGICIQVPPIEEQRAICDFIDRETAKIDEMVAKKQKMIDLLKEKRQALITHAVTKGLNPKAKMKPSGIDWLGDIAEGWEVKRLNYLLKNVVDKATDDDKSDLIVALENMESWSGKFISPENQKTPEGDLKKFVAGDVLFGKLRPYLAKAMVAEQGGLCVGEVLVFRTNKLLKNKFLLHRILTADFINYIDSSTQGAKMPRAEWEFIKTLQITYPSVEEQRRIIDYIDRETAKIDKMMKKVEMQIEKLQEYRQALITNAVTGKIKFSYMKKETFESLWKFCTSNNRVCPMPMKWNDLFNFLHDKGHLDLPLILNGWEMSSPLEKNLRFKDHIESAATHNQFEEIGNYLRSLKEEEWAHYGEI